MVVTYNGWPCFGVRCFGSQCCYFSHPPARPPTDTAPTHPPSRPPIHPCAGGTRLPDSVLATMAYLLRDCGVDSLSQLISGLPVEEQTFILAAAAGGILAGAAGGERGETEIEELLADTQFVTLQRNCMVIAAEPGLRDGRSFRQRLYGY